MKSMLVLALLVMMGAPAHAEIMAQWIQLAPGSNGTPSNVAWGDAPTSMVPTILARAVIDTASAGCPAITVDGTLKLPMHARFDAAALSANLPLGGDYSATPNYPTWFVAATTPGMLPDSEARAHGWARATTAWTECEAVLPGGHRTAVIDGSGASLKLPVANPQRILVIADSGCRMARKAWQNCHDPVAFPIAALADFEAQFKPDLIIHVGDYFYRDVPCTAAGGTEATGCPNDASTTWADSWDAWNLDFFYPAKGLLQTAPWVMVRGNHESCGRGARGWFALLEPRPFSMADETCGAKAGAATAKPGEAIYSGDFKPSYLVPAGALTLVVFDDSFSSEQKLDANMAANYSADLTTTLAALPAGAHAVIAAHKPAYGLLGGHIDGATGTIDGGDATLQSVYGGTAGQGRDAFAGGMPEAVSFLLSGHIHQFEYIDFADKTRYAPQLIVGVGGSKLDKTANPNDKADLTYTSPANASIALHPRAGETVQTAVSHAYSQAMFGFGLLDASATGYVVSAYASSATLAGRCTVTLSPRDIACWK